MQKKNLKQICEDLLDTFLNAGKKVINAKNVELKKLGK